MPSAHFIGIGGSGLSAIAEILLASGWHVSGSDQTLSPFARTLAERGAVVHEGHSASNLNGAELVIISSAIAADNIEVVAAKQRGLPILKRADFLGRLMTGRLGIAVAGTHGKTTTTGLIAFLLDKCGFDPTFIVGGVLQDYGTNARAGQGPFVIEADEYDRMFLGLLPTIAVVTNIEHDHPDIYPTLAEFREAFRAFAELLPADGILIACADDPGARDLAEARRTQNLPTILYGLGADAQYRAEELQPNGAGGFDFLLSKDGRSLGLARNRLPGRHNVLNSLAALAVADQVGAEFNAARNALAEFHGAGRRFEVKGEARGVTVVDDYAHHPTEIKATLAAARLRFAGRSLWVLFQPHTYSRVRALRAEFANSFADADHVIMVDIYRSREAHDPSLTSEDLVRAMRHRDARYIATLPAAAAELCARLQAGDVLLTLGAGDGNWVGQEVLRQLGGA